MKVKHLARIEVIEGGHKRLVFNTPDAFRQDMNLFAEGRVWVMVETYRRNRSEAQNGVLHWYCTELAKYTSMEVERFKMIMKLKFLQRAVLDANGEEVVDPETGEIMLEIPSTKDLNTLEMSEFTENIRMWALDFLRYSLPLPDKNYKLFKKVDDPGYV